MPSRRNLLMYETRMTAVSTDTPISASSPRTDETLKGVLVSFSAISAPTGSVITTPRAMVNGKFEIAVEREQDQEDEQYCQRADHVELLLGGQELAVLAAPLHPVAFAASERPCSIACWPSFTARSRSRPSMLYWTPM